MEEVARFGSGGNISCFADQLRWETIPARQEILRRLLIEEENCLGATEERLLVVERKLADGAELISRQRQLIDKMKMNGGDTRTAESSLKTFEMIQELFEKFRAVIYDANERKRL